MKLVFNTTKQTDSPLTMYAKVSSSDRKDIVLDTQIPVSYTHLDVYKRQPA